MPDETFSKMQGVMKQIAVNAVESSKPSGIFYGTVLSTSPLKVQLAESYELSSELRYSEPKTKSGRRQVPILPNMIPVLKAHQARQDAEKAEAGSAWNSQNLVFCSNVGTVIEPRRVCTTMDKITDAAGLPRFTFHALRHTFATRMLEANVPAKVVQDVLGHADVTLTLNTYSHVIGSTAHEQMAKINGLFQTGDSDIVKQQPVKKQSIKQQLAEAKQELKTPAKQPPTKGNTIPQ